MIIYVVFKVVIYELHALDSEEFVFLKKYIYIVNTNEEIIESRYI